MTEENPGLTRSASFLDLKFDRLPDGDVVVRIENDSKAWVVPSNIWPIIVANMAGWTPEKQTAAESIHK